MEDTRLNCALCGNDIPERRRRHHAKYCSEKCGRMQQAQFYRRSNEPKNIAPATVGTMAELRVAVDLLGKGYEVFRSLSPSCSCDLAILKNNQLLRIEVRTGHYDAYGKPYIVKSMMNHKADILVKVFPQDIKYYPKLPQ